MQPIIQCVPNFSEGRDVRIVESIVDAARSASTARIADYSSDSDHNRMVLTLLGSPDEIRSAVYAAASEAVKLIDLRSHAGVHPRIGAVDVVPLVPVQGISMADCVQVSHEIGRDIADNLSVPVYFYERSATQASHTNLPDIRRGGFERLSESTLDGVREPDLGPNVVHPTAGATVVGARGFLVAYNINLGTDDLGVAKAIVKKIRSGEAGLEGVRSISVPLATRRMVQVSMNIIAPEVTSMSKVYAFVAAEASALGVERVESEVIGIVASRFLGGSTPAELNADQFLETQILDSWL